MTDTDENTKLLKQYQKLFKMFIAHMNECPDLERKVLKEFEFDE